jgi:sulfur carrier protein ThiS
LKIIVESIGLAALSAAIGRRVEIELERGSLADLVDRVLAQAGPQARRVLLDSTGKLDASVQVMVNDEGFVPRERLAQKQLKHRDRVRFMLLACGG